MGLPEFCDNVAAKMASITGNRSMEGRVAFGLEILISFLLSAIAMIVISSIFGVLRPALLFALIVFVIKSFIGGAHLSYPFRCAVFGALVVSSVVKVIPVESLSHNTVMMLITISALLIVIYAPAEAPEKPLNLRQRERLRVASITIAVAVFVVNTLFTLPAGGILASAMLWQSLMITPIGFRLIAIIDRTFDRMVSIWSKSERGRGKEV